MFDNESSPEVRVFMTEEEVLWHEFEHGLFQQESSPGGNAWTSVPSARALSHAGAGPSGREAEVDSEETEEVDSEEHAVGSAASDDEGVEAVVLSQPGEGMLINNPKSNVSSEEVRLWRYMYKIPQNVRIRVPAAHERVDWVVPGWVAIYELMLKDGMRFPIPRLIRDVCDHYEISPSQLMPNA